MQLLLQNIAKHIGLSADEESLFLSKISIHTFEAKYVLLNPGEICTYSYFVNSGILRSFTINDNTVEQVLHFATEGYWISDLYSLLSKKPTNLFIQVLEDAELILLAKDDQEALYTQIPKLERFFRILTENALVANQERLMDSLSLTAEERFEKFCRKHPSLIQRIPQKQIASYIGVTPEFFSKMKGRLLRK
jgi:CRP-like cAMP-binding protein